VEIAFAPVILPIKSLNECTFKVQGAFMVIITARHSTRLKLPDYLCGAESAPVAFPRP